MPTKATEGAYSFDFLVNEFDTISVDKITVANGQNLVAGAIITKTFVGTGAGANEAGNTGNPTIGAVTVLGLADAGDYRCRFTAATVFQVYAPDGRYLGAGATGTAFLASGRVGFTITAGATPAVAGDIVNITVTEGASTYAAATGTDATAILAIATDASGGAKASIAVTRLAEFHTGKVSYGAMDAAHILAANAALARRHIVGRSGF